MDAAGVLQRMGEPTATALLPWIFQALLVLSFALHIVFVNLVIGNLLLAVWGHFRRDEKARRLSRSLARSAAAGLAAAIVLGMAPLLFMQALYDPFWYGSMLLSASWALVFLLVVVLAGVALFFIYARRRSLAGCAGVYGAFALLVAFCAAVIIHVLAMQSLIPDQWISWSLPAQQAPPGWGWESFAVGRFLHFMLPALVNTGIFLMLYAWFLETRGGREPAYAAWVGSLGARVALFAVLGQVMSGVWWLLTVPGEFNFASNPWLISGFAVGLVLTWLLQLAIRDPARYAQIAAGVALGTVLLMSGAREALRIDYLRAFGYAIHDYPRSLDWGSTLLFFAVLIALLLVLLYPLRMSLLTHGRRKAPSVR